MRKYDLIILGAGIVGCFAAYFSRLVHPHWKIALLEARAIGTGATRFSAGVHLATGTSEYSRQLAARSAEIYANLESNDLLVPDDRMDAFWIAPSEAINDVCKQAVGFSFREADSNEHDALRYAYPEIRFATAEVVLRGGTARCFDPPTIARQLVRASVGDGLDIHEGTRITDIRQEDGFTLFESAIGERFVGKRSLLCNGPWLAKTLGAQISSQLGLRVKKVGAMHLESQRNDLTNGCALFFPNEDAYIVPLKNRLQYMLSFASRDWDCDPDSGQIGLSRDDYRDVVSILARRFGDWQPAICGGRVFCDTYTADGNSIACLHPIWPGVVIAGAGGGAGFRLSPAIAERALALLD